jgi:predicted aspartyl protease
MAAACEMTCVPFVVTDPLPIVEVRVNDGAPVNFFIDTGGPGILLDSTYAKELGLRALARDTGFFGGGKSGATAYGIVDSISIGDIAVRKVPATLMDVRRFSQPVFGGRRVDGIIGSGFLYHFLATVDYPRSTLTLRRKTAGRLSSAERESSQPFASVPFWMREHFMFAQGSVQGSEPMLFLVDTGLAGAGFACPPSTLERVGIQLDQSRAGPGIGGGGSVTVVPFTVSSLSLGEAHSCDVPALHGVFPPFLENSLGFRVSGLVSHEFFKPYAVTFDFTHMRILFHRRT